MAKVTTSFEQVEKPAEKSLRDLIKVGDHVIDLSLTTKTIWVVVETTTGPPAYSLVNLNTGALYAGRLVDNLRDVFYSDEKDFVMANTVDIAATFSDTEDY